jgi:hypothetical protein
MWRTLCRCGVLGLVGVCLPAKAGAQAGGWGITADVSLSRFWGASRGASTADGGPARPYRPTGFGIRLDRRLGARVRAGIGLQYAGAGLGIEGSDLTVIGKGAFDWVEIAPELAIQVARLGANSVRAVGGPVVDLWMPRDDTRRTRLGGRLGLELDVPFGRRVSGVARLTGALTPSIFDEDEILIGYERRAMTRAAVGVGLRVRL